MRAATRIASRIIEWFRKSQRDLPWRRTRDPYAVWVSEIMLQQTQVKTVISYWERWMRELPTVSSLAKAKPERVLKLWEGLGYYSRARNLQAAAKIILERHGGDVPREFAAILELPGVGRYTAGAIASIAFGEPAPILDGNVVRVLARYFGVRGDPKSRVVNEQLWKLAEKLVCASAPMEGCSELNQGLMELGALVCLPREPNCRACPLQTRCLARGNGLTSELPETGARPETTKRVFHAVLARSGEKILARKRADGFWELPNWEVGGENAQMPVGLGKGAKLCEVKHSVTRFRITLKVYSLHGNWTASGVKWIKKDRFSTLPVVTAHRRALEKLRLLSSPMKGTGEVLMENRSA